jgi:hypothetical protein
MKIKIDNLTITVESSNPVKTDLKTSTALMEKTKYKKYGFKEIKRYK